MNEKIKELYERTLNNCKFYERENDSKHLLNEIGVLRGIAYAMEAVGECPHNEEFLHYIEKQNELFE